MENTKDPTRETVLILRTCKADHSSFNGFVWPESGYVEASDWDGIAECGNGLHGWLKGQGDISLGYMDQEEFLGQVVETYADHLIDLDGKVKFPYGWVVFTGDMKLAAKMLSDKYPGAQGDYGHGDRWGSWHGDRWGSWHGDRWGSWHGDRWGSWHGDRWG